jgi:predicted N-acyltransferase
MKRDSLRVERHASMANIDAAQWDALTGGHATLSHALLDAFETSGCVSPESGWQPDHLALYDGERLVAALPGYLKSHSYGEYVFDWAWAEALERTGRAYYPKLLCAVPFTPVPGPRLLAQDASARAVLLDAWLAHARSLGVSSAHLLFPDAAALAAIGSSALMLRESVQFHWHNASYRSHEEFLATLSADKRKKIRQERRRVRDAGVTLRRIDGADISDAELALFVACYRNTYRVRGQRPYLNARFFELLRERTPQSLMLVIASRDGQDIACALNLRDDRRLYGRYWGEMEYVPCLHFEACYHQGIEYAIERGLQAFEGGAQGEHKMARGFTPVRTWSAHWLRDEDFSDAVARYLERERAGIALHINELEERTPYRIRDGATDSTQ